VGDVTYVAWQNASPSAIGDRVLVAKVALDPADNTKLIVNDQLMLPQDGSAAGPQVNPRLGASPLFPSGALISAWEDATNRANALKIDFRPSPFVFLNNPEAG
jgi:hypothetical protein